MSTKLATTVLRTALRTTKVRNTAPTSRLLRFASSSSYPSLNPQPRRGIKIGHVFSALALLGIGATSYGLYQFYQSFTVYPDTSTHPIRSKLRAAIRAESTGEYERSHSFFQQAYDLALDLYTTGQLDQPTGWSVEEDAWIKLSGIAVRWGGMWEQTGQLARAIEVYDTGFQPIADFVDGYKVTGTIGGGRGGPTKEQVQRGASIALKLGDLWVLVGNQEGQVEAERYYTWAVQELMRLSLTDAQKDKVRAEMDPSSASAKSVPFKENEGGKGGDGEQIELPSWIGEVELVAAFERLGDLYSRQGKIELAQPLLQQAIATLYPPPKKDSKTQPPPPPIARRCHAATLMNNLSSALVAAPSPSSNAIEASARWARQSLNVANSCKREADKSRKGVEVPLREKEEKECELTAVVSSYNLGKLSEMSKDTVSAEQWFIRSQKLAQQLGLKEASLQASEALRRLKHPTV